MASHWRAKSSITLVIMHRPPVSSQPRWLSFQPSFTYPRLSIIASDTCLYTSWPLTSPSLLSETTALGEQRGRLRYRESGDKRLQRQMNWGLNVKTRGGNKTTGGRPDPGLRAVYVLACKNVFLHSTSWWKSNFGFWAMRMCFWLLSKLKWVSVVIKWHLH